MTARVFAVLLLLVALMPGRALSQDPPPREGPPRPPAKAAPAPAKTADGASFTDRVNALASLSTELETLCEATAGIRRATSMLEESKTLVDKVTKKQTDRPRVRESNEEKAAREKADKAELALARIAQAQVPKIKLPWLCDAYATPWPDHSQPPSIRYRLYIVPLKDKRLAAAALATDPEVIDAIIAHIRKELSPLDGVDELLPDFAILKRLKDAVAMEQQTGVELAATAFTDLASVALAGLAKLIEDRARYEAIGWFMTQLGERVCVSKAATTINDAGKAAAEEGKKVTLSDDEGLTVRIGREMTTHFMPSLCALANKDQLWEYGAGAALWESFQASVRSDIHGLPGTVVGLAPLGLATTPAELIGCDPSQDTCKLANKLRTNTATRFRRLVAGEEVTQVLVAWGTDLAAANALAPEDRMQLLGCAVSMPSFVNTWRASFSEGKWYSAFALATLTGSTNCQHKALDFKIGIKRAVILGGTACDGTPSCMVEATKETESERITSLILHSDWLTKGSAFEESLRRWVDAKKALDAASNATRPTINTELQVSAESTPKSVSAAVDALARGGLGSAKVDAAFGLADASIDVSLNGIDLLIMVEKAKVDAAKAANTPASPAQLETLGSVRTGLVRIRSGVEIARNAAKGEWAVVVNGSITFLANDEVLGKLKEVEHIVKVAKELSSLVAVASAKDPDEMAKAIDALADPPGGWRLKRKAGRTTVSLTAHPGFYFAEETRWGPYGAKVERASVYPQPPTLALPVGLEIAQGLNGCAGPYSLNFLIWALDPAAFLAYDVSNEGRLPGPSVLTALAPGLEMSFSLGNSPFNFGPFIAFRPGYRQWEPDADGAGAHVLQVGGIVSVDVTLYSLMSSGGQ